MNSKYNKPNSKDRRDSGDYRGSSHEFLHPGDVTEINRQLSGSSKRGSINRFSNRSTRSVRSAAPVLISDNLNVCYQLDNFGRIMPIGSSCSRAASFYRDQNGNGQQESSNQGPRTNNNHYRTTLYDVTHAHQVQKARTSELSNEDGSRHSYGSSTTARNPHYQSQILLATPSQRLSGTSDNSVASSRRGAGHYSPLSPMNSSLGINFACNNRGHSPPRINFECPSEMTSRKCSREERRLSPNYPSNLMPGIVTTGVLPRPEIGVDGSLIEKRSASEIRLLEAPPVQGMRGRIKSENTQLGRRISRREAPFYAGFSASVRSPRKSSLQENSGNSHSENINKHHHNSNKGNVSLGRRKSILYKNNTVGGEASICRKNRLQPPAIQFGCNIDCSSRASSIENNGYQSRRSSIYRRNSRRNAFRLHSSQTDLKSERVEESRVATATSSYSNLTKNNYSDYTQASREILPASNLGSLTVNPLRNKTSLPHNLGQESLAQEPLNEPQNIELIYSTKPNPNKRGKPTRQLSHSVHLPERPSHYRTADRNYFTRNSGHGNSGFVPTLGTSTYLGNNSRNRLHYQSKRIGKAFDIDSKINQSITDNLRKKSISTSNLTGGPANRNSSIKTFRDFKNRNKLHNCKSIAYQDCSDQTKKHLGQLRETYNERARTNNFSANIITESCTSINSGGVTVERFPTNHGVIVNSQSPYLLSRSSSRINSSKNHQKNLLTGQYSVQLPATNNYQRDRLLSNSLCRIPAQITNNPNFQDNSDHKIISVNSFGQPINQSLSELNSVGSDDQEISRIDSTESGILNNNNNSSSKNNSFKKKTKLSRIASTRRQNKHFFSKSCDNSRSFSNAERQATMRTQRSSSSVTSMRGRRMTILGEIKDLGSKAIGAAPLVAAMRQRKQPRVPRFMQKNGHCNIRKSASEKRKRYLSDFFTTMVDLKWSYSLLVFLSVYIVSWLVLSFAYWLIAYFRGQLWSADSTSDQVLNANNPCIESISDKRCFYQVDSYMRAFLFFVETDQTIGYGRRAISHHCPEAIVLFVFQCLYGTLLDAFIMGCIFIKISKPTDRNTQLIFSENACICQRDGKNCLMFRVGNLRNSLIVQCRIRGKLIKSRQTPEGEFIPLDQTDINLGFDNGSDKLFLVTPLIVTHIIDERSPLWEYSYDKIRNDQFEIIIILEGTVESTGSICQARTSYLNTEIIWGHRFNPLLFMDTAGQKDEKFKADLGLFNSTYEVPIPKLSAKEFKEQQDLEDCESMSWPQNDQAGNENGATQAHDPQFIQSQNTITFDGSQPAITLPIDRPVVGGGGFHDNNNNRSMLMNEQNIHPAFRESVQEKEIRRDSGNDRPSPEQLRNFLNNVNLQYNSDPLDFQDYMERNKSERAKKFSSRNSSVEKPKEPGNDAERIKMAGSKAQKMMMGAK